MGWNEWMFMNMEFKIIVCDVKLDVVSRNKYVY